MANFLISRFIPDFVMQGFIDQDYTMLAMRRYVEAMRFFWSHIITKVKMQNSKTVDPLGKLQRLEIRSYRDARRNFESAQSKYDSLLSRYASLPKTKEPSSIREDAFTLAEAKKAYVKASFDLTCITQSVCRQINIVIIDTMADPWLLRTRALAVSNPWYQQVSLEMYRIKSWSRLVVKPLKALEAEMLKVRQDLEQKAIEKCTPSRDLEHYTPQFSTISHFVLDSKLSTKASTEKHGWLFVKTPGKAGRYIWQRRWAFVRNSLFGWLILSPNKLFVQESDKLGVLLCNVSPEPKEDRRFCFEVRTKDTTLVLQAESLADLKAWLKVFELSKRKVLETEKSDSSRAFNKLHPPMQEFASSLINSTDSDSTGIDTNGANTYSFTSSESQKLQSLMISGLKLLTGMPEFSDDFTTLCPFGCGLVPKTLANVPMPTSMTREAIIANSLINLTNVPSAITANYWGSVNWALYQENSSLRNDIERANNSGLVSQPTEPYPSWYPIELQSQDTQMRAIFQSLVDDDPEDRVVLYFRCLFRPNQKQEIPCRNYVTPKNLYVYSTGFGLTAVIKKPIQSFTSIEGKYGKEYDTLYIIYDDGHTATARLFLDSGKLVRRRIQFIIDNSFAEEPLALKEIIGKLQEIGEERRNKVQSQIKDSLLTSNFDNISDDDDNNEDFGPSSREVLERYLVGVGNNQEKDSESTVLTSKQSVDSNNSKVTQINRVAAMTTMAVDRSGVDHLIQEKEFDIPSKALFHLMFGEKSIIFREEKSASLLQRDKVKITPWHLVDSTTKREREISYVVSQTALGGSQRNKGERVSQLQRIERKEENHLYVVYDRKPIWELPQGAMFYIASRYIIVNDTKTRNSCKLYIYCSVEWLKPALGPVRRSVENIICNYGINDANQLVSVISDERKKLGTNGLTITSIRLFGRLGSATLDKDDSLDHNKLNNGDSNHEQGPIIISQASIITMYWVRWFNRLLHVPKICITCILKALLGICSQISVHRILFILLMISVLFNLVLLSTSALSFWTERSAENLIRSLNIMPNSQTVMTRSLYLSEINDMINTGQGITFDTDGACYDKFKSLAYSHLFDDYEPNTLIHSSSLDEKSLNLAQDINKIRTEFGIRRNELLVHLRVLNAVEKESLIGQWRKFLLQEIEFCSMMNEKLNNSGLVEDYCHNCLENWRMIGIGIQRS